MRNFTFLLLAVLLSGLVLAQNQPSKPMSSTKELSPFEQELIANQHKFTQAFAEKNIAYVNQSIADDFRGIGTNGDFYDKEELAGIAHYGMLPDVREYDMQVIRLNDESAVVTYNLVTPGGRPRYRHMSDTWAKEGGQWKLKFQQVTANLWSATDTD
jgi:hypothetical protein